MIMRSMEGTHKTKQRLQNLSFSVDNISSKTAGALALLAVDFTGHPDQALLQKDFHFGPIADFTAVLIELNLLDNNVSFRTFPYIFLR